MAKATFRIWRGADGGGGLQDYPTEVSEGMVVLDAVHQIQADDANDLAVRWNCKAGKCGSCSAEINGKPRLMCMTRLNELDMTRPVTVEPMRAFPHVRDLVTDVSWNFRVKKKIQKFAPRAPDAPDGTWRMQQSDIDRVQEFRKCIECFLCQDVCHVLRDHQKHESFIGPRFLTYVAALEMHPLDTADRRQELKEADGIGFCNITKCCTVVCPEGIRITDNAIIPLKERVVDKYYDPVWGVAPDDIQVEVHMIPLKSLSISAIPLALEKAERYRLLNQPWAAENICLDILQIDPGNQEALRMLLLARTDQFGVESAALAARARETLAKLTSPYEQAYYAGIICERLARARLEKHTPGAGHIVYAQLREAMAHYERAEPLRPAGDDDSILRWNSCARLLNASPSLGPRHYEPEEMVTGE